MTNLDYIKSKFYNKESIINQLNIWSSENKKIIFTNGCFDILHKGHVEYLAKSKDLGDILIIGLNSDKSVKKLKGESRPINNQNSRSLLLSSLLFVDAVICFDEDTPLNLIEIIKPDILVKGGDYKKEDIIGYDFVIEIGGEVKIIDLIEGYSTTNIIKKSRN
jgi:rfaE bifunctional protein nucleotidyltransferase chain/domain